MEPRQKNTDANTLLLDFFSKDDLKQLAIDTGTLLNCPLLILDATFHIAAYYMPSDFSDAPFQEAVRCGEITYEAGAYITRSPALSAGIADYIHLPTSAYQRRFAPLSSSGVQLGYLVCVDLDGHLNQVSPQTWHLVEQILAKQLFVEASRQNKLFETAEDILTHLLDGGFSSEAYFRLQAAGTYLADFHPFTFALMDLTTYRLQYLGNRHLKEEIELYFSDSHPFLYKGYAFLFLHKKEDICTLVALAKKFQLKSIVSEPLKNLFDLSTLCRTAREAMELIMDERFHGKQVYSVAQLRVPLILKTMEDRSDLISPEIRSLAAYDRKKGSSYCETLYYYLICCHSLKKTCDALFTHRNTILYRIRKMQEDFSIQLDEPTLHADLLMGVSLVLFQTKGPDFFLQDAKQ